VNTSPTYTIEAVCPPAGIAPDGLPGVQISDRVWLRYLSRRKVGLKQFPGKSRSLPEWVIAVENDPPPGGRVVWGYLVRALSALVSPCLFLKAPPPAWARWVVANQAAIEKVGVTLFAAPDCFQTRIDDEPGRAL
jgi:hypothetical protein